MTGIICAMKIEYDGLCQRLTDKKEETVGGIVFHSGKLNGRPVVMAICGIGKVFAAMCAQTMILRYHPECIINSGVAGSLSSDLAIGDIALSTAFVQHDMDTSPLGDPKGFLSGIDLIRLPADDNIRQNLHRTADDLGYTVLEGVIASGDKFVADGGLKAEIIGEFGAIACDMEGGAIAQVCYVNNVPCMALRAISDSFDGNASMDYAAFAEMSADRSIHLLSEYLK